MFVFINVNMYIGIYVYIYICFDFLSLDVKMYIWIIHASEPTHVHVPPLFMYTSTHRFIYIILYVLMPFGLYQGHSRA